MTCVGHRGDVGGGGWDIGGGVGGVWDVGGGGGT